MQSMIEKTEKNENIVNIERISDCIPLPKVAKNAILDFQSSALPTELPSLPRVDIQPAARRIGKA